MIVWKDFDVTIRRVDSAPAMRWRVGESETRNIPGYPRTYRVRKAGVLVDSFHSKRNAVACAARLSGYVAT